MSIRREMRPLAGHFGHREDVVEPAFGRRVERHVAERRVDEISELVRISRTVSA